MIENQFGLRVERPQPAYLSLSQQLASAIRERRMTPGSRLPEERELAQSLKLSRGTVRRALSELEEKRLVVRIQGRGTFVVDEAQAPAVPLAVILEGGAARASRGFPGELFAALMAAAADRGAELLLRESPGQRAALEPAAFVFLVPRNPDSIRALAARGTPAVAVDYTVRGPGVDSVVFDNARAGYEATQHLLALGHRRIGYVDARIFIDGRFEVETNSHERLAGHRRALREAGIREEFVWPMPLDAKAIHRELPKMLRREPRPTACFAFDETVAEGAWLAARELGWEVPRDLSIACLRLLDAPPRAGVDWTGCGVSVADLGRLAVERALERVRETSKAGKGTPPEGRVIFAPHQWCPGSTTAAPQGR